MKTTVQFLKTALRTRAKTLFHSKLHLIANDEAADGCGDDERARVASVRSGRVDNDDVGSAARHCCRIAVPAA
eukprot:210843-Prymnesium_polylepis.1